MKPVATAVRRVLPPGVGGSPASRAGTVRDAGLALVICTLGVVALFYSLLERTGLVLGQSLTSPLNFLALAIGLTAALLQHPMRSLTRLEAILWAAILAIAILSPWSRELAEDVLGRGDLGRTNWNMAIGLGLMAGGQLMRERNRDTALVMTFAAQASPMLALNGYILGIEPFHGEMPLTSCVGLLGLWLVCIARFFRQRHIRLALSSTAMGNLIRVQFMLWTAFHLTVLIIVAALGWSNYRPYLPMLITLELVAAWALVLYFSAQFADLHRTNLQTQKLLKGMAERDPLTRLATRRVAREFVANLDPDARLGVLIADIDHFKKLNDDFGHACGDHALTVMADLLRDRVRRTDLVVRWGGEEFVVLLRNMTTDAAVQVAEELRQAVAELAPPAPASNGLTVSVGVTVAAPLGTWKLEDLVAHADLALYAAKSQGRNRVFLIDGTPHAMPRAVSPAPAPLAFGTLPDAPRLAEEPVPEVAG